MTRVEDLELSEKQHAMFLDPMFMAKEDMIEPMDPIELEVMSSLEQQTNGNVDCTMVYPLSTSTDKAEQMMLAEQKIEAKLRHLGISHGKVSSQTIGSRRYHRKIAKQRKKYTAKYKPDIGYNQ